MCGFFPWFICSVNIRNGQVREAHQEERRWRWKLHGRRQILRTQRPVDGCGRCCGLCTRRSTTCGPSKVRTTGHSAFADFVRVAGVGRLIEKYVLDCHCRIQQHIYIYIESTLCDYRIALTWIFYDIRSSIIARDIDFIDLL